jgi:hypothetical protein
MLPTTGYSVQYSVLEYALRDMICILLPRRLSTMAYGVAVGVAASVGYVRSSLLRVVVCFYRLVLANS